MKQFMVIMTLVGFIAYWLRRIDIALMHKAIAAKVDPLDKRVNNLETISRHVAPQPNRVECS